MLKWVKYIGVALPLLGFAVESHWVNVVLLPFLGGVVFGLFATRRDLLLSPIAVLAPIAAVLLYYAAIDLPRLMRFIYLFPLFVLLWIVFWAVFFTLGALAGRILSQKIKT
ncbi:hypothetical protein [Pyrobaculum calidifontis]|uniref:Uncharacterized protein n=1 Tax=Pyrobaculum calidifontis (strain DSM 21063 / JCM 11548 / VA1) TaxID=410359 RepID=A3MX95_PYRCJ|nr:hypothetical protein [Pyrobaculum calidifontis]ABO09262.1 conserved hypothetical protein [Pyrobaculum calidifontis JCM 11548]